MNHGQWVSMTDQQVFFYPRQPGLSSPEPAAGTQSDTSHPTTRVEPATCAEAETFVLRVLDDSMEPEFRRGCVIVIDPTGRATDGSYVLARRPVESAGQVAEEDPVGDFVFRQLVRQGENEWLLNVLNPKYKSEAPVSVSLSDIVGVIVQRAGVRRRYHKRYD